jgi:CheY-like chemotaxis protein
MRQLASILIVDDDFDIAEASRELLESAGHSVRVGHNGEEGLASLAGTALPDCLLLDVDMPRMNGPGMAHEMLLHDAGEEKIPILLVSGRNDLPAVAARMGTPYFLAKGSADYGEVLLKILDRAIIERRPPATA